MLWWLWSACSSPSALDCAPIEGVQDLLAKHRVLVVGELHGTVETPRFTGDLLCHALQSGKPALLALELPADHSPTSPFWTQETQDGRSSQAMADLLARAQAMKAAGKTLDVVGFDVALVSGTMPAERDRGMAEQLMGAMEAHPDATVVVLTGNLHGRRTEGMPWDPLHQPMAAYLKGDAVASILARASNGEAWNCQSDGCSAHAFGDPDAKPQAPALQALPDRADGYDFQVEFGRFSASPPYKK